MIDKLRLEAHVFEIRSDHDKYGLRENVRCHRTNDCEALSEVTEILEQCIERDRIPAIVRMPCGSTGGASLMELARQGRYVEMLEAAKTIAALRTDQPGVASY